MELVLTKLVDSGTLPDLESQFLKFDAKGIGLVAFWGGIDGGTRNIVSLRNQKLPLRILIESPDEYSATEYLARKYGLKLSIPESAWIQIDPDS